MTTDNIRFQVTILNRDRSDSDECIRFHVEARSANGNPADLLIYNTARDKIFGEISAKVVSALPAEWDSKVFIEMLRKEQQLVAELGLLRARREQLIAEQNALPLTKSAKALPEAIRDSASDIAEIEQQIELLTPAIPLVKTEVNQLLDEARWRAASVAARIVAEESAIADQTVNTALRGIVAAVREQIGEILLNKALPHFLSHYQNTLTASALKSLLASVPGCEMRLQQREAEQKEEQAAESRRPVSSQSGMAPATWPAMR